MLRGSVPTTSSRQLHTFSRAPQADIPRSVFNRSHGVKTTFNEGLLVPIFVDEMLPGDTFNLHMHAFARMSTPLFPIMDNLYLESFFFAVPYRLVWDNWEKFNGFQFNPGDSTDYLIPTVTPGVDGIVQPGDLADYMGVPIEVENLTFNSLHLRAYNLIWNEWFRDENLQDSLVVETDDGPDTYSNYTVQRRGKRYDYFTSCLPFPQKGPDVTLPLGTTAPVVASSASAAPKFYTSADSSTRTIYAGAVDSVNGIVGLQAAGSGTTGTMFWSNNLGDVGLSADLTDASASTINDLRLAFQTQKLYERDARGGTRYTEIIRSHFHVVSPDMRLQRPEYIGGGSTPILINPVVQSTYTSSAANQLNAVGRLAAYGVCAVKHHGFTYSATEHMLLIGLVSVRADLNYQQGLERMWSRQTRLDYYWPALAHIGEQAVLNQEIYAQGASVIDESTGNPYDSEVFGYQERFAEYRYKPSQITGQFRSVASAPLDSWHLAQKFTSLPVLGSTFIQENAPMSRILAVSNDGSGGTPDFIFDCFFNYKCARPMPVYSIPGLVDHF